VSRRELVLKAVKIGVADVLKRNVLPGDILEEPSRVRQSRIE